MIFRRGGGESTLETERRGSNVDEGLGAAITLYLSSGGRVVGVEEARGKTGE